MAGSRKKWGLVVVGVVAAVTLGAIGVASAASNGSASPSPSGSAQSSGRHIPDFDGDGPRGGFDGADGRRLGGFGGGAPDMAEALAKLSGKDVSTIMQQHESGKTFAQLAKTYGVGTDELLAKATAIEKTELDAAVKAGTMTDAQRTQILSGLQAHLKEELTEVHSGGFGHGPDGDGFGGSGLQAPSSAASPSSSGASLVY